MDQIAVSIQFGMIPFEWQLQYCAFIHHADILIRAKMEKRFNPCVARR